MKKLIALILCTLLMFSAIVPSALAFGTDEEPGTPAADVTVQDEIDFAEQEDEPVPAAAEPEADAEMPAEEPVPLAGEDPADPEPEEPDEVTLVADSVSVKGVLPEGAELVAEEIADPFAPKPAKRALLKSRSATEETAGAWEAAAYYDIKLLSGSEALRPEGAVTVTIENVPFKHDGSIVSVRHFLDDEAAIAAGIADGSAEALYGDKYAEALPAAAEAAEAVTGEKGVVYVETITEADGLTVNGTTVSFPAKSFSVYAVGSEHPRIKVVFHLADGTTTVEMLVKKEDTANSDIYNTVLYDPTSGDVPAGMVFRGWATTDSYDANTTPLDIDGVRAFISNRLNNENLTASVTEQHIYAMVFYSHNVAFIDEANIIIKVENVFYQSGTIGNSYTINEPYTPASQDANFVGWKVSAGSSNISAPANGLYYPNGTSAEVSGDVVLEPYLENGYWITFIENGRGASYTGPQFVKNGQVSHAPEKNPTRLGFSFGGWYTDQACTDGNEYPFELELTGRLTLYAKWIEVDTANYTIIIWKQNVGGTGYDFEEAITGNDNVRTIIDDVNAAGTGNERHAVVNGTAKTYKGFHLRDYDTNVSIVPEGTSVLNVYYDRNTVTLNFYTWGNTAVERYEETSDSYYTTSEQYALVDGEYIRLLYSYSDGGYWYYETDEQGYVATTSNSNSVDQFGLVDGQYVKLTRHGFSYIIGNTYYWTYVSGYEYNASNNNSNTPQKYGYDPVTGQYYPLEKNGNTWYMNGEVYRGQRYTRSEVETRYEGTRYVLQDLNVVFTGIRYKKVNSRWTIYESFQGLYGSTLAANGKTWPAGYDWYDTGNDNGSVGGSMTTFLDAFLPSNGSTSLQSFYGTTSSSGSATIHFLQQNPEKTGYVEVHSLQTSGGTFYITDKFSGFTAYQYSTDNVNWYGVGTYNGEYYGNGVSYSNHLYIRFNRDSFKLAFFDGIYVDGNGSPVVGAVIRGKLNEVDEIVYGADLTGYNKGGDDYYAPEFNGYVFEGWYLDKNCTQSCTFSTMPEGGLSVYAKWRQIQYRVFLHPNIPLDEEFEWADETQSMSFRINYNEQISNGKIIDGVRDGYEIVGWYRDQARTVSFNFEAHLTEQTVFDDYDTSRTTELDKYGEPLGEPRTYTDGKEYIWDTEANAWYTELNDDGEAEMVLWNKDAGKRFWIEHSIDLYAKWRKVIDGALGIDVQYDGNGGTPVPVDESPYLDQAPAVAKTAPTTFDGQADGIVFKYWVVQTWSSTANNGLGGYVDTNEHVLPGCEFTVQLDYAQKIVLPPEQQTETVKYRYVVQLRAEYGLPDEAETTKLVYDGNGGTLVDNPTYPTGMTPTSIVNNVITFEGLTINEEYEQLGEVFTRPGYTFLGWSTDSSATAPEFTADQLIAPDILNSEVNTLYAVWEEKTITINYVAKGPDGAENFGSVSPAAESGPVKVFSGTASGSTATAGEGFKFVGWYSDENCETLVSENADFVPQKDGNPAHYPYESETLTYYAKFEFDTTTLTITNSTGHDAVFTVTGVGYDSGLVLAIPAGKSLTIANVYVGETYTVTEDGGWSWRYTPFSGTTNALEAGGNSFSATLVALIRAKWLSGTSWAWKYDPTLYGVSN